MRRQGAAWAVTCAGALMLCAPPPGHAATVTVSSWSELATAVGADCSSGDTVQLAADVQDGTDRTELVTECGITIDLNGRALTTGTVVIADGTRLTITDARGGGKLDAGGEAGVPSTDTSPGTSGTPGVETTDAELAVTGDAEVIAAGGVHAAGIGGRYDGGGREGGDVVVTGDGMVTATGGEAAAGIGGSWTGHGGSVLIRSGADVDARGGDGGAGIGGGALGNGGTTTVADTARATASGGGGGADVGGGRWGDGGTVTVAQGAEVVAAGASSRGESAIGAGAGGDSNGTAQIAGTLRIEQGVLHLADDAGSSFTVAATGLVTGPEGDETGGGSITGPGAIANRGVIALTEVGPDTEVTDNAFDVRLHREGAGDPESLRVYAPRFAGSYRDLPAPGEGYRPWRTGEDGSGDVLDETTPLAPYAETVGGDRVVDVSAAGVDTTAVLEVSPGDATVGDEIELTATVTADGGAPSGAITFAQTAGPGGPVQLGRVALDGGVAMLGGLDLAAGEHELTASFESPGTGYRDAATAVSYTVAEADETVAVPEPGPGPEPEPEPEPGVGESPQPGPGAASGPAPGSEADDDSAPPTWTADLGDTDLPAAAPDPTEPDQPGAAPPRDPSPASTPTGYGHDLRTPGDVLSAGPVAQAVAAATALGFLLLVAVPLELLYGTLRQNYGRLVFAPASWRRRWAAWRPRRHPLFWRRAGAAAMILTGAGIATLAEPALPAFATWLRLFCALALSLAVMNLTAVAFGRITARRLDLPSTVRLMPGFLLIAAVGVLMSRVFGLHPGILFGLLAMTVVTTAMRRGEAGRVALAVNGGFLALGVVAWVLYGMLDPVLGGESGFFGEMLREILTAMSIGCIGAVTVALLPITYMGGRDVFRWSKPLWAVVFSLTLLLFALVVLPLPESWEEASGPALVAALVFGGFGALSLSVWAWFRFRPAQRLQP